MPRNTLKITAAAASALLVVGLAASTVAAGPPFAEASEDGKQLVVSSEHASMGTVFHTLTDRDRQIFFESDAPLEKIKGQSNKVIGYTVWGSEGSLLAGEWHLPVESIRTGIDLRDEHLASSGWLDADKFENIVFQIDRTEDIKLTKDNDAFKTYSATLVGEFTIHGVTRPVTIENASVTHMKASDRTKAIAEGNLLAIRAKYSITLSDYDVSNGVIGDKVANNIEIDTVLYFSDAN